MERHAMVFWRNFIGIMFLFIVLLSGLMLGSLYTFPDTWMPFIRLVHIPEMVITGAITLLLTGLLFLFCALLALHVMINRKLHI